MVTPNSISTQLNHLAQTGLLPLFTKIARQTGVPRNFLLAIASRESNMGLALDSNYQGDYGQCGFQGCGIGIMQIDRRHWPVYAANNAPNDHEANIMQAAVILKDHLDQFSDKKLAAAAYNAGAGSVQEAIMRGVDPDRYTTGKDYARDVLQREQMIAEQLGPSFNQQIVFGLVALGAVAGLTYQFQNKRKAA